MVVTGTRADYGLLLPVMRAIKAHAKLELQVVATGMHLLRRFGMTVREIEADGWRIDGRVGLQGEGDDVIGQSRGLGRAIGEMTKVFFRLKSEVVLVLGDRLEAFAAAATATASQLVLGHIHGGDVAVGVQDEAYRHAISKLAHLHFAVSAGAKQRLLRMGEVGFRVYQTGSPALDGLSGLVCRKKSELSRWAGFDVNEPYLVVLQHPAGGGRRQEEQWMEQTLRGCGDTGLKTVVLYPNCDAGFSGIIKAAQGICRIKEWRLLRHVPRGVYLGLLRQGAALVGNSSSGLIEGSRLGLGVVNVGPRQLGRERGRHVVDVDYGRSNVAGGIARAMRGRHKVEEIYGDGRSGRRIASILARVDLDQAVRQKRIAY